MRYTSQNSDVRGGANEGMLLPAYTWADAYAKAKDYFANVAFYRNEAKARSAADDREAFLGDMTMKKVFEEWNSKDAHKAMSYKLYSIGAMASVIIYFMNKGRTIEDMLHQQIIALNAAEEIELIDQRFVDIRQDTDYGFSVPSKFSKIVYVLGPSGCGKTFFGVKQAATYGWESAWKEGGAMYTTVYVDTARINKRHWRWTDEKADRDLFDWIQDTFLDMYPALYDKDTTLKMNIAVVMDGVDAVSLADLRAKRRVIHGLYDRLFRLRAEREEVRLIVCGKGFTSYRDQRENWVIHLPP
jgi:hypothetical protein